ncbi:MAG: hypothetical protein ACLFUR_05480 [Candidatus Hadarchaeia archaeon]
MTNGLEKRQLYSVIVALVLVAIVAFAACSFFGKDLSNVLGKMKKRATA